MPAPSTFVLIPESTRKDKGGEPATPRRDDLEAALPPRVRNELVSLRGEIRRASGKELMGTTGLLPAYRRYQGNMYRHIPEDAWEARSPDVEVLVVSGFLGLVASRDTVPWYAHSMAEPFPHLGKLNRWWHASGLPRILRAYLAAVRAKLVVDLLSLEYREAVAGFAEGLAGVRVERIDFPGLGRASQPRRGERVAGILRRGFP